MIDISYIVQVSILPKKSAPITLEVPVIILSPMTLQKGYLLRSSIEEKQQPLDLKVIRKDLVEDKSKIDSSETIEARGTFNS